MVRSLQWGLKDDILAYVSCSKSLVIQKHTHIVKDTSKNPYDRLCWTIINGTGANVMKFRKRTLIIDRGIKG